METAVPYHSGLLLGCSVDTKTLKPGIMLIGEEVVPAELKVNLTTSQFSFATSLKDVCDVLSLPPEYALKVKAGIFENKMVDACLKDLGKPELFTIIFRITFLEKQYFHQHIKPVYSNYCEKQAENEVSYTTENLTAKTEKEEVTHTTENLTAKTENKEVTHTTENLTAKTENEKVTHTTENLTSKTEKKAVTHTTENLTAKTENEEMSHTTESLIAKTENEEVSHNTESLIAEAIVDSELNLHDNETLTGSLNASSHSHHRKHWIKAVEIGNELVTVMTLSCKDMEKLDNLHCKLGECLQANKGQLDITKIQALLKVATDIDKKLSKKHNEDVSLGIWYCTFTELDKYPASLAGMVNIMDGFMDQCVGWAEKSKQGSEYKAEVCIMRCVLGTYKDEKKSTKGFSFKQKFSSLFTPSSSKQINDYHPSKETQNQAAESNVDNDQDGFVVLSHSHQESPFSFTLRVTLQALNEDDDVAESFSSLALTQYTETTDAIFYELFKLLINCKEAEHLMKNFLSSGCYLPKTREEDYNQLLKSIKIDQSHVHKTVADLDFVFIHPEITLESLIILDPLSKVQVFIEDVTSKLPPGSDIDLLMIGKTGHGKSSTANSILGQNTFVFSADTNSVTSCTGFGWAEIDDRVIKVVDTPGVCDTSFETDASSIDLAIKSISTAISGCPDGFHGLVLVIRFGVRMTSEEKKAIDLLKHVLGKDIVRSHCILILTHGDNFEAEIADKKTTFENWCSSQTGFFKSLYEECDKRCVLFNNKVKDPKAKKAQIIQLVSKVDSLKGSGTRYTNHLFEFAQKERKRIISEDNVPQVNEEIMREVNLILNHLNNLTEKKSETKEYRKELSKLKEKVDNLRTKVSKPDNGQFGCLLDTITSLDTTIQSKMDEISKVTEAESNKGPVSNKNLAEARDKLQTFCNEDMSPNDRKTTEKVTNNVSIAVKNSGGCFPRSSLVILLSGNTVPLEELQVGDKVLVRDNAGHLSYDTVYMFGHKEFETSNEFIAMKAGSYTVYVTAEHYVYCIKHEKEVCVAAKDVQVGDCLLVVTSEGLMPKSVETITFERKQGLFAPFTNSGSIIIDGVLMSCYINVLSHTTCHTLLWPVRQLYRISPRMLSLINGSSLQYPVPRLAKAALKLM